MTYAAGTSVPAERSRAEIERVLERYGADQFAYGWSGTEAVVAFRAHGRHVKFTLPMPDPADPEVTHKWHGNASGRRRVPRTPSEQRSALDQLGRERWRALALVIKAKLEAVETGIVSFEQEFLAHVQLPNGQAFYEWAEPQVARAYELGQMPELMPASSTRMG